jgi:hypothetical protein
MGMPITLDIPYCEDTSVFQGAIARFREIDQRFSAYKVDSEVRSLKK